MIGENTLAGQVQLNFEMLKMETFLTAEHEFRNTLAESGGTGADTILVVFCFLSLRKLN